MKPLTTRHIWLIATILTMTGAVAACQGPAPVPIPQIVALSRPARPVLPAITAAELSSLSDDVYRRLAERNRLQRHYAEQLEVIIDSTRNSDK